MGAGNRWETTQLGIKALCPIHHYTLSNPNLAWESFLGPCEAAALPQEHCHHFKLGG